MVNTTGAYIYQVILLDLIESVRSLFLPPCSSINLVYLFQYYQLSCKQNFKKIKKRILYPQNLAHCCQLFLVLNSTIIFDEVYPRPNSMFHPRITFRILIEKSNSFLARSIQRMVYILARLRTTFVSRRMIPDILSSRPI